MDEERDDLEYRKRRERRKKILKRRQRARLIARIVLTVCVVIVISVIVALIAHVIKKGKAGSTDAVSGTSGQVSSAEVSASSESTGVSEATGSSGSDASASSSTPSAAKAYDNSTPWTYTTTDAAPTGDIVATDNVVYTYDQMEKDLYFLQMRYSDKVEVRRFGTTLDGRDLLEAVIGSDTATKDIVIQYSMHAREYICTLLGMKQLEYFLANYDNGEYNGSKFSDLAKTVRFHIIPMMNPDGVTISQLGIDGIRDASLKAGLEAVYKSDLALGKGSTDINEYWLTWKANARSVDLNRNFATTGWTTEMGTQQPSCSRYPGTSANSEPEVKALISLTESMNTVCEIAYHCHGRRIFYDYGMESVNQSLYEQDYALAQAIDGMTAQQGHDAYELVSTVQDSQNPGGCSDYYMQIVQIPALTIEVGRKFKDDGSYNDPPLSIDEFPLMWEENTNMLPAIAQFFAGS